MKKFAILFLALALTGFITVAPVLEAQSQADIKKMEKLAAEAEQIGKRVQSQNRAPTAAEQKRIDEIGREMAKIMGISEEQFKAMQQQDYSGQGLTAEQQRQMEEAQKSADAYED